MTDNKDHFGEFRPHTKLKHTVLESYLEVWAFKLLMPPRAAARVWFLDAFAGRGRDDLGNPGSPTLACRIAMKVRGKLQQTRGKESHRLGVFAIEAERQHFEALDGHLAPFKAVEPDLVQTRHGTLDQWLSDVLSRTSGSMLAFLDPFGFSGLDAATYRPLLERRGSEIFALLQTEGSHRIAAAYQSDGNRFARALERALAAPTLFADEHAAEVEALARKADAQRERNADNRVKHLALLTRALGSETRARVVLEGAADEAPVRTQQAFRDVFFEAGAMHVTFLPVSDEEGRAKHMLAHATASETGVIEMKRAISKALENDEIPLGIRARLEQDLHVDASAIVGAVRDTYRGQCAPWALDADESVQWRLYVNTGAFPHHRLELEAALKAAGYLVRENRRPMIRVPVDA